jgi:hypothetical protein
MCLNGMKFSEGREDVEDVDLAIYLVMMIK